jgi:F1F0 ATPase subunit 2
MREPLVLLMAWVAGCALGAAFFAGLWWTVRHSLSARHPALWILGSLLVRMAMLLVGFYFVADGQWQRLLACTLGFVTAKLLATRMALAPKEARHAP